MNLNLNLNLNYKDNKPKVTLFEKMSENGKKLPFTRWNMKRIFV